MLALALKFGDQVLKEVPIGAEPIIIGRSPENDIFIDNLAVSSKHAQVFVEEGQIVIQDLGSLNGTLVNGQRIEKTTLSPTDTVQIGKHTLTLKESFGTAPAAAPKLAGAKIPVPKLDETFVLETKKRKEVLGEPPPAAAAARLRLPSVVVLKGKTDQKEYLLSSKLTVIGKSEMATIRLKGWFAPKIAAQINKRDDGYYLSRADKTPKLNGREITSPAKLNEGDIIEVGGVQLSFTFRD